MFIVDLSIVIISSIKLNPTGCTQRVRGACSVRTCCWQGGGKYALFVQKNIGYFEIYGVFTRTGGVNGFEPVKTVCRQGKGVNFSRFCADVFYEQLL